MHPVIRIIFFLVYAVALATGGPRVLILGAVLLVSLWLFLKGWPGKTAWPMLLRLRWLLLAIVVFYLGFTPGEPLWTGIWAPSEAGLAAALHRGTVLLLMVLGVATLTHFSTQEELLNGIYHCAKPLSLFGLSPKRLALRLHLTMTMLTELSLRQSTAPWRERLLDYFDGAMQPPERIQPITLELGYKVALWQWLWPLALSIMFALVW